jgi:hypothetical protein
MTGSEYICAPELVRVFFPCFYSTVTKREFPEFLTDQQTETDRFDFSVMHSLYTLNHAFGRGSVCPIDEYGYDDPQAVLPADSWKQFVSRFFRRVAVEMTDQHACYDQLGGLSASSSEQETLSNRESDEDLVGRRRSRSGVWGRGESDALSMT